MNQYALDPIGYVRNDCPNPDSLPYQGAPSVLELEPGHLNAAAGLEPGFVWVLTWLDRAERLSAQSRDGTVRGSFSSRSPVRLNPIAITAARLLHLERGRLTVDALDVCDGTPLLDVKPYVREFDCVFGPADPAWRRAATPEERLARIVRTIERFCGPLTPETALGARAVLAVDRDLDVPVNRPDLHWECRCASAVAGAVQAISGAPLGSPRLLLGADEQLVRAQLPESSAAYWLLSPTGTPAEILVAKEELLFARVK